MTAHPTDEGEALEWALDLSRQMVAARMGDRFADLGEVVREAGAVIAPDEAGWGAAMLLIHVLASNAAIAINDLAAEAGYSPETVLRHIWAGKWIRLGSLAPDDLSNL